MFASLHTATLATRHVQSVGSVSRLRSLLARAFALSRPRKPLAQLDDRSRADTGLGRRPTAFEPNRPLWDFASRAPSQTAGGRVR